MEAKNPQRVLDKIEECRFFWVKMCDSADAENPQELLYFLSAFMAAFRTTVYRLYGVTKHLLDESTKEDLQRRVEQHPEVSFLVNSTHCEIHGDGPTIFRQFIVRPEPGFPSRLGEAKRYGGTYYRAGVIITERNGWQFVGHRKEILQLCREGREAIEQFAREVILTHRANVQLGQAGSTHQVGQSNLQ